MMELEAYGVRDVDPGMPRSMTADPTTFDANLPYEWFPGTSLPPHPAYQTSSTCLLNMPMPCGRDRPMGFRESESKMAYWPIVTGTGELQVGRARGAKRVKQQDLWMEAARDRVRVRGIPAAASLPASSSRRRRMDFITVAFMANLIQSRGINQMMF
jgi:hypothetical protein